MGEINRLHVPCITKAMQKNYLQQQQQQQHFIAQVQAGRG